MVLRELRILIIAEGISWAGIESHLFGLINQFSKDKTLILEVLLFSEGNFSCWVQSIGVKTTIIKNTNFFQKLFRVYRKIKKNHYQIIHTHSNVALYLALCFPLLRRTFWCNTQHGKPEAVFGLRGMKDRIARLVVYSALRYFTYARLITVSYDLADWVTSHKRIPCNKIRVIQNGVWLAPESYKFPLGFRESIGIQPNDFLISIVGRLIHVKGHNYLLEAIYQISCVVGETEKRIKVLVIGDGPLSTELNAFCKEKGIESYVHFLGYREDALSIMAISDAIVFPSIHEGIPYTLLEAMWMEKPIIASNVGGLKEVLTQGKDGILFSPKKIDELRDAILKIAMDKKLAKSLGKEAGKKVREKYSLKRMADETRAEYSRCYFQLQRIKTK